MNLLLLNILQSKNNSAINYAQQGEDFLIANARTFHDFSQLSGTHGSTITTSEDLTSNNRDLTNNPGGFYTPNTPTVFNYRYYDLSQSKTHSAANNQPLLFTNNTTNTIFATSHEIHISLTAKSKNFILRLFGINSTQVHYAQIETDGKISLFIKRSTNTTRLRSVSPVFTQTVQNGDLGSVIALSFRYNFTSGSEQAKMYINGVEIATELVSGDAVTSWNPAYTWNNLYSFAVGAEASATNTTGNAKPHWNYKFAVTGLLSQDERNLVVHQMLSTTPQTGKLVLLGDSKMPIATGNKTYQLGVYLSQAPASNVTVTTTGNSEVSITGGSLTFTPANYNVPQSIKFVGTANYGMRNVTATLTMSGGFSGSTEAEIVVAQSRVGVGGKDGSDVYLTDGWNSARLEANNISIANAATLRDEIKTTLFKGSYPSGIHDAVTTITGYGGVTLANANAGVKNEYTYTEQDEGGFTYTNYVAHIRNTSPNNKLFIQLFGHGETGHQELYDAVIAEGYDWAGACLAFAVENTENNPNLTGSPSWLAHDQLFTAGVDTETFDARRLFLFDKIRFLDYILTQHAYTEIVIAGVSGGGWNALFWAQFDNRITKVFNVRGANSYNHPESGSDFEQGPSFLTENFGGAAASEAVCGPRVVEDYRTLGYLKRIALVCANGADFHHIAHELDVLGGGYYIEIPKDIMTSKTNGKYYTFVNTNSGQSTHGFALDERTYIIDNL